MSLGVNCRIQNGGVCIGDNVIMGPDVLIYTTNHAHDDLSIPICFQGEDTPKAVVIEDDVWIGARAIILPGVTIKKGSIVGAGTVLSKTFPEYSIIGGNPGKVIGSRKKQKEE